MKENLFKKVTAIILALCIVMSLMQAVLLVAASGEGNVIFNNGDITPLSHNQNKVKHDLTVQANATVFGDAVALAPTVADSTDDGYVQQAFTTPTGYKLTDSIGLAFYLKVPADISTGDIVVRLSTPNNKPITNQYDVQSDSQVTLIPKGGSKTTVNTGLTDLKGYEGYVFIPFNQFKNNKGTALNTSTLKSTWNLFLNVKNNDSSRIGKKFCFDQIGFYEDVDSFYALSESELLDANFVFNKGTANGVASTVADEYEIVTENGYSILGNAVKVTSNGVVPEGWVQFPMTVSEAGFNYNATKGIAAYVEMPVGSDKTSLSVRIINKSHSGDYYQVGNDIFLSTATLNATIPVISPNVKQDVLLKGKAGFKGWIFLPYEAFNAGNSATVDKNVFKNADTVLEFKFNHEDPVAAEFDYIIDEVGFYNDPSAYAYEALGSIPYEYMVFNTGTADKVTASGNNVYYEVKQNATAYANGLSIGSNKSGFANIPIDFNGVVDTDKTNGIAMYVRFPSSVYGGETFALSNGSTDYALKVGANVTLIDTLGVKKTVEANAYNLSAFEGFVFIDYSQFEGFTKDMFKTGTWGFKVMNLGNDKYIFDEFGIYADIDTYTIVPTKPADSNAIFNSGVAAETETVLAKDVTVEEVKDATIYGDALKITPNLLEGSAHVQIPFNTASNFDFTSTAGIAMYVDLPNSLENSGLTIRIVESDWLTDANAVFHEWKMGEKVYLVDSKGMATESQGVITSTDLAGYKGWVFIPYSAMAHGNLPKVNTELLNNYNWCVEIGYYAKRLENLNQEFIFDEIGIYSDIRGYMNKVAGQYTNTVANGGAATDKFAVSGSGVQISDATTTYGDAYNIVPTAANAAGKLQMSIDVADDFVFPLTEGVAIYTKTAKAALESGAKLSLVNGTEVYTVSDFAPISRINTDGIRTSAFGFTKAIAGYEGFLFVPYNVFENAAGKTPKAAEINETDWKVEFSFDAEASALGELYIFDEIGFYSNEINYIKELNDKITGTGNIINIGDATNATRSDDTKIKLETKHRSAAYGDVILSAPLVKGEEVFGTVPFAYANPIDTNTIRGLAFYAELPKAITNSGFEMSIVKNDDSVVYNISDTTNIVMTDRYMRTIVYSKASNSALSNFSGFIFVPFSELGLLGKDLANLNVNDYKLKIKFNAATDEAIAAEYRIDEIGFYTNMETYIELAKADLGKSAIENPDGDIDIKAEAMNGNYIFHHGDTVEGVWEDKDITRPLSTVRSPYGLAYDIIPEKDQPGSGYGVYRFDFPEDEAVSNALIDNSKGIAFYLNMPNLGTQTQMEALFYFWNDCYWVGGYGPDGNGIDFILYDMEGNRTEIEDASYAFANMQGFQGYVFMPFDQFEYCTNSAVHGPVYNDTHRQMVKDLLKEGKYSFNFRLNHYRWNENEVNLRYTPDELGFYSDEETFIRLVKAQKKDNGNDTSGNFLLNDCDNANELDFEDAKQIDVTDKEYADGEKSASKYAVGLRPTVTNATKPFVSFPLDLAYKDFSNTNGMAFYVEFPETMIDTQTRIMLYCNDVYAYSVKEYPTYTLVDLEGNKTTHTPDMPLQGLAGFKGYVFIPYSEILTKTGAAINPANLNQMYFELRIGQSRSAAGDVYGGTVESKFVYFDSIGLYNTIDGYLDMLKVNPDIVKPEKNDFIYNTYNDLEGENVEGITHEDINNPSVNDKGVVFEKFDNNATGMGDAIKITQTEVCTAEETRYSLYQTPYTSIKNHFASAFSREATDSWAHTNGFAFYVEVPLGAPNTELELLLYNADKPEDGWKVKPGGKILYVDSFGDKTFENLFTENHTFNTMEYLLPLNKKGGFKGFVFVPFSEFRQVNFGSAKLKDYIDTYQNLEFRINFVKKDDVDINVPYVFDSVGLYNDPDTYIKAAGYQFELKKDDSTFFNTDTDSMGYYLINNLANMQAVIRNNGVDPATSSVGKGMDFGVKSKFSITLRNYRYMNENNPALEGTLIGTEGLRMYIKDVKNLDNIVFKVDIVDQAGSELIEKYTFDSTVSDFFYEWDGVLYYVEANDLRLPEGFEGYIYLPFDNFAPNEGSQPHNLVVDPNAISEITVYADMAPENPAVFTLADVAMYKTEDMLKTMIGAPINAFDTELLVKGERATHVMVNGNQVRFYGDFTFQQLFDMLSLSNPHYTMVFVDEDGNSIEDMNADILADFEIRAMAGKRIMKKFHVTSMLYSFVKPEATLIKPAVAGNPGKTVVKQRPVSEKFDTTAEDFVTDKLFTIKKSAEKVVMIDGNKVRVKQVVTVGRLLSAFNLFNGVGLKVYDANGRVMGDTEVVLNSCDLVVTLGDLNILKYDVSDVPLDTTTQNKPTNIPTDTEEEGFQIQWWMIVIAVVVVVAIAGGVLFIILFKKKKAKNN